MLKNLKSLKSLFVVDETAGETPATKGANPGPPPASARPSAPAASTQQPRTTQPAANVPPTGPAAADEKMTNSLMKAIDAANLDGFDYLEYKRAVKGLQKFGMDEVTKYRSAFTTASTMGVTLPELVSSAQHYIHIIDGERDKFQRSFEAEFTNKVTQAEGDVKRLRQEINDKAEQIKKLQQEIEQRQQQVVKLEQATEGRRTKVLRTRDAFTASYNQVKGVIQADIERMKRYLQ